MKTLVTGGSGYLGTYVRQFFSADDFSRRSGFNILEEQDAERVRDYDAVIHFAAHFDKSPEGAQDCFLTNAEGTRNLLRFMRPGSVFHLRVHQRCLREQRECNGRRCGRHEH